MKQLIAITIFLLVGITASTQEIITDLQVNPVLSDAYKRTGDNSDENRAAEDRIINLPFFDDFTYDRIYPTSYLWIDRYAFINTSYAKNSINRGVATLDALDKRGNLHPNVNPFQFPSDTLTSLPIRMDSILKPFPRALSLADSIYFSFHYQPQGNGNAPEASDSLVLEFGYDTLVFAGYYDSITVLTSEYVISGDSISKGDTIFSPPESCSQGLYRIADQSYFYNDTVDDPIRLPCDTVLVETIAWYSIWNAPGETIDEFCANGAEGMGCTKAVIIPVNDSAKYYRKGFRVRFRNYASLANEFNPSWRSNADHWNIDYVYLDLNRNSGDTVYRDISFAERAPSLLKDYYSMPYNQYKNDPTNVIKDSLKLFITNLDTITYLYDYFYTIVDKKGIYPYKKDLKSCNLEPFVKSGYQPCIQGDTGCRTKHACPPVNYIFPLDLGDSALFRIDHVLIGDVTAFDTIGDTATFYQKFYNYYAYDDGTPEAGYGLTPSRSQLAYKFSLNVKDTLRAVQMFFNRVQGNSNQQLFNLRVWGDNGGIPGEILYEQLNERVEYSEYLNEFYTYYLDDPLLVNGIFYIGWEQQTSDNLNLGWDWNSNARSKIFFNTTGEWSQSQFTGALLMRPMLGKEFSLIGLDEQYTERDTKLSVYPNPLGGDVLRIKLPEAERRQGDRENLTLNIYNTLGQVIRSQSYKDQLSMRGIERGIYIVRLINEATLKSYTARLIITR